MKNYLVNRVVALTCVLSALSIASVSAEVSSAAIEKSLNAVQPPEMPAKAGSLVSKAKTGEKQATTVEVVKKAIYINPASAAAVVGAIAYKTHSMASLAAATAVSLEPKQAVKIARAAVSGAPSEADKIVAAMSKESPSLSSEISQAVAQAVKDPSKGSQQFQGPPHIAPPFVPRVTPPSEPPPTVVVGPGDRDYSSPF
jgi:hypothetical protein